MSEVIAIQFPDISGDATAYTAFVRNRSGALLNTGGDTITETGATGLWTFTLGEDRVVNTNYFVRIYSGVSEVPANLVYDGVLFSGQLLVDEEFQAPNVTLIRGVVGGSTTPTRTTFTASNVSTPATALNQWVGRVIIFNNDTVTAALRGQAAEITGSSNASLPLLTFTELTNTPVSTDTFTIV